MMLELFQDKRVFLKGKKKPRQQQLPDIKYSPNLVRRFNEDLLQPDHARALYSYQPLSNILISKKIPTAPQDPTLFIRKRHTNITHNFKTRKESLKRISGKAEDELDVQSPSEQVHRNSTSLSHRPRVTEEQESPSRVKSWELTFSLVRGNNNEDLVRSILLDRKVWREVKVGESIPAFKWTFFKDRHNYKRMSSYLQKRVVNHFQFSEQICTKDLLVHNLQMYCETKGIELFSLTPLTFTLNFDEEYCEYSIKQFIAFFIKNDPRKPPRKPTNFLAHFQPYMAFQNSDVKKKVNPLSRPISTPAYYSEQSYLWLLKPTGLNRGRGIEIFDSLEQLENILQKYLIMMNRRKGKDTGKETGKETGKNTGKGKERESVHQNKNHINEHQITVKSDEISTELIDSAVSSIQAEAPKPSESFKLEACSFVIQKYVERPFLIEGRKFDIRVWVLVTGQLQVYFFKEGYIRTSAEEYSTNDITNYFIHLTNNAIQKQSQHYGQFENANQLSFKQLSAYMNQEQVAQIWSRIKEISFMCFSSVKRKLNQHQRKHCFELFGLDFIIDYAYKVWLIEVNENPCIQCSSPLLAQLIPRMLSDSFRLTIDQLFEKRGEQKAYPVKGYSDTENLWEHLGQLTPNGEYHRH